MKWLLGVGLVSVALGCGSSNPKMPDAAGVADAAPDAQLRTVTGKVVTHLIASSGQEDVPGDLSHSTVEVLVGSDFTPIVGTGNADGTFSIPDVPVGEYYFNAGGRYFVMSGDTLDLEPYFSGRISDVLATAATDITFNMTALAPWQSGDELELYAPQSGTLAFDLEASGSNAPVVNDTSLTNFTYDLSRADRAALPSAAAGDTPSVLQLSAQTDGTRAYHSIARTFSPAPFTLANGGTASITGAFTTVDPSNTLTMNWDRPAFAAEVAAHYPQTFATNWSTFAITALQGAETHGYYDDGPDVLVFAPGYQSDTSAVTAAWPYGDPFPTTWGRIAWLRFEKYRSVALPGGSPASALGAIYEYRDLSVLATQSTIEPDIGLVVNPTINGMNALGTGTMTGIGLTPALAWEAPTVGTAAKYYVNVFSLQVVSGATTLRLAAMLETPDTHVTVPPGVLAQGHTYVFRIDARATSVDLMTTPLAMALPDARAELTTSMATP